MAMLLPMLLIFANRSSYYSSTCFSESYIPIFVSLTAAAVLRAGYVVPHAVSRNLHSGGCHLNVDALRWSDRSLQAVVLTEQVLGVGMLLSALTLAASLENLYHSTHFPIAVISGRLDGSLC